MRRGSGIERGLTLGFRVGLALLVPVLTLVGIAVYQMWVIDRLVRQNREIGMIHRYVETAASELREDLRRLSEFGEKLGATGDPAYREAVERARTGAEDRIDVVLELPLEGEQRRVAAGIAELWSRTIATDRVPEPASIERLDARVIELAEVTRAAAVRVIEDGAEQAARARRISRAAASTCVLVAAILSLVLAQMVIAPVRRVERAARDLSEGDFSRRARPTGPPELARLANAFNAMAERLGEIDRLKETLVSNVSHDLKAPLASMYEANAALLDEITGPLSEGQRTLIERSQQSNARLSRMVSDLLDLSRLQGGAMTFEKTRLDLTCLVLAAVDDLKAAAEARGVTLEVEAPDGPVEVEGDQILLLRVLENLLSNAIRYSPAGESVRLTLTEDPAAATLVVDDRGPGIPDEHKAHIFERFYRVGARVSADQGTGVGLAIAASVIAAHGGSIRVEDEPAGGARFVIEVPRS